MAIAVRIDLCFFFPVLSFTQWTKIIFVISKRTIIQIMNMENNSLISILERTQIFELFSRLV